MTLGRYVTVLALVVSLWLGFGCSKKESGTQNSSTSGDTNVMTDSAKIQAVLDEVVTRWRYGDKGGLYDMEWEYLQNRYTFDQYLAFANIKSLVADTMERMVVTGGSFWPKESAQVFVDVQFKGPTDKFSTVKDTHWFFYSHDRWIRPIAGARNLELEYEQLKHIADSAAAEESKLEGH